VHRLQGTQLFDDEEQEEARRQARNEEVLQALPTPHDSSRDEIGFI
jgi:hypothetical protein